MTNCIHDHARWGAGDQLGAGHLLTAETTLAALGSVKGKWLGRNRIRTVSTSKKARQKASRQPFKCPIWMSLSITSPSI